MSEADLDALDFSHIRRRLERLAITPYGYGKEAARHLEPAPTLETALVMQRSVSAARAMLSEESPALGDLPQVRPVLRQTGAGGATLRPQEKPLLDASG